MTENKNIKVKITLTESDCEEIRDGEIMDWNWTAEGGESVDVVIGKGRCCDRCDEEVLERDLIEGKDGIEVCGKCNVLILDEIEL